MRLILATIVLVGLPALAVAQSPPPATGGSPTLPPIGLPLPSITLPLPSISPALPAIGLPPASTMPGSGESQSPPGSQNARPPFGSRRNNRPAPTAIFFVPAYEWGYPRTAQPAPSAQAAPPPSSVPDPPPPVESGSPAAVSPTGRLRLEVQPADALQLFADGYYVGTAGDVNSELELEAGPHSIEIRAAGYETLAFDVKIAAGRSITYRAALKRSDGQTAPAPVPAARPTTFYYIPGCYMGNVPPEDVALPPTCDLSRLVTRKP